MKLLKIAGLTAALLASTSAFAAQKDITVVADVDPNIEMLQADGSALPQVVRMNYIPGAAASATPTTPLGGLQPVTIMTKIFTNDVKKAVLLRLVNSPVLAPTTNTAAKSVPLSVSYNLKDLTTTDTTLAAKDIFPANVAAGAASSQAMPLTIRQTTPGALDASSYSGVVSLVVTQGT
ncbi:hypothetical protein ABH900_001621 [Stenotrophomonas sp. AN71]|uniref:CS1 type fimbrial major subunit n=1 Tax=Stenotrophomonas sp. AN71 TaxID=3156253 RepID=UPI003D1C0B39